MAATISTAWRCAGRQLLIVLRGVIEAEATIGETVRLRPGDVGLAADLKSGHITRVIEHPARPAVRRAPRRRARPGLTASARHTGAYDVLC
ncbi:hypothetical protein ACWEPC_22355 [Nonomuraea sp. NPDC004297]